MRRAAATFNFPAKAAKFSLLFVTAATGVAVSVSASALAFSDASPRHLSDEIRASFAGISRSAYTVFTIASTVVDYKYSLRGLSRDSDEYPGTISEVHLRSAKRILKMCEDNRGFYVKAGQFAASLRQLPKEYTATLSALQDQAVPCNFRLIKEVISRNFGSEFTDIFISFDEQPIAAASIAQVHHAVLRNREEVAVKVQYPGLEKLMELDIATMSFVSEIVSWLFPEYRFEKILSGFKDAVSVELDFVQEARNSERTANNFRSNKNVKVPGIHWDLTTSQVLTMQFCSGHKVDDLKSLEESGIDPRKVAKALVEVFADMIFVHGFVHGDPHPGNILVSPKGQQGFTLVLLDHGMYKELDEGFRNDYCRLWKALILRNANEIQRIGECFGVGSYVKYLPLIFTGKPINSKSALSEGMTIEERNIVKQELKTLAIEDISTFMESLPTDLMIILRTDSILRSILGKLGASRSVRLLTYAKYAVCGLSTRSNDLKPGSTLNLYVSRIRIKFSYLQFQCLLAVLGLLSWIDDIKQLYNKSLRSLLAAARRLNLLILNH